ncbi:DNA-directed RNA polymerase [Brevundimonas sp.]|uniref:DNA-directed RNA polymerase n=2 Tax=Brevundimonas sp. TaxID=1871086 RepID=UPI002FCBB960
MGQETFRQRVERQIALEEQSRQLGIERYRADRAMPWSAQASSRDSEADSIAARELIRLTIEPCADAIREFTDRVGSGGGARIPEAAYLLEMVDAEEAALLTARVVLNATVEQKKLTATAIAVADAIIEHIQMARLRKVHARATDALIASQRGNVRSSKKRRAIQKIFADECVDLVIELGLRIRTGMKLIDILCDQTGLFEIHSNGRNAKFIRPTTEVIDWLERQHARCEILAPLNLPMLVRPRRWTTANRGGYVTRQVNNRLIKQANPSYHRDLDHYDLSTVMDAVNAVQDTAWRINQTVLNVARELWDSNGELGGLPHREPLPLPDRPHDFDHNEIARSQWKREAAFIHDSNGKSLSRRLAVSQQIWIAEKFAAESEIYFPHSVDFRGRVYPIPASGPSPQGDDLSRALLEFAQGHPITDAGARWLAVHLANQFGVDKISFEERVEWVFQHTDLIIDSACDPLDGQRFWAQADKPFMALSACVEWAGYMRDGPNHITHLPVALDGSNSGLQHFSALLLDPVGAAAVNLEPSSKPADVYEEVAAVVRRQIASTNDPFASVWQDKITRKITKRPVMTYVYSATRYGFHEMVNETLRELDRSGQKYLGGQDNYAASIWMGGHIWTALSDTVVAATDAMQWLRQVARITTLAGIPLRWNTPCGLPILQDYKSRKAGLVSVVHAGRTIRLQVRRETRSLDSRRQQNAISPNFIHSMDASHLMSVANRAHDRNIRSLGVVHDSFATHASHIYELRSILRETFAELYREDWLAVFADEIRAQLPTEYADLIPPPPMRGSFDITRVLESEYLFS